MAEQTSNVYHGLFINLDRSEQRRREFEKHLAGLQLETRYPRFRAVDGHTLEPCGSRLKPGEVGAFLSHYRALEEARQFGKCVHILEDDALLSRHVVPVIEGAIQANYFDQYDLLFTDMTMHCHIAFLKSLKIQFDRIAMPSSAILGFKEMRVIDLARVFHAAFQSYVVGAHAIDTMLDLYRQEIQNGPTVPVDIFVQRQVLAGKLKAACVFPLITSFRLDDVVSSTISEHERIGHPTIMAMAVLRYLYFVDCDLNYAKKVLDAATLPNRKPTDMRHALTMQVAEFVFSEDFLGS
jgi:GR25 family glycosyltransferase involved in LPS biosynthesis